MKKVPLQRQLPDGLEHPGSLPALSSLLLLCLLLCLAWILKYGAGVLQKLSLPVADHVGVQVVLCCNLAEFLLALMETDPLWEETEEAV